MNKITYLFAASLITTASFGQQKTIDKIKTSIVKKDIEAHMTFLAADEMRGRDTGSPEIAIAANYLAAQYSLAGLKIVPGMTNYFQEVGLQKSSIPKKVDFILGNTTFELQTDLVLESGNSLNYDGDIVFVGYGTAEDFSKVDVKGKVVLSFTGTTEKSSMREAIITDSPAKQKIALEKGAVALIEILTFVQIPWENFARYFSGPQVALKEVSEMPHAFLRKTSDLDNIIRGKSAKGKFIVDAPPPLKIDAKNVIGLIEGTDPQLKKEYIALTAHYDHIGVSKKTSGDSINNGARDNALGIASILEVAKYLVKNRTKRSILIIAYTGEEAGLLGSEWYVGHPVVPLVNTVFNMDCDGAGYNDKTIATLIDLNRTTADASLQKATTAFGLKLMGDPVPDQHLYERSDNYNFAVKGVPAVDFSPGFKSFDAEIFKYYHQPADEVGTLDFDYLEKFVRAYVYAASLIGDAPMRPMWKAGDKFEEAGKLLYGIK